MIYHLCTNLYRKQNKSKYSVCSYSKCGKYLAAGGENGEITVWDIDANKIISEEKNSDNEAQCITAIDWNPMNNGEFAYTDNTGQFGLIENINDGDEDILEQEEANEKDMNVDFGDRMCRIYFNFFQRFFSLVNKSTFLKYLVNFLDDAEDADNENCVSLEKLKKETLIKTVDDEIGDISEETSIKTGLANDVDDGKNDGRSTATGYYTRTYELQASFQPSATSKALEHRYMVWNHIGIVRSHSTNSENSIEVEFHDASIHHGLHMVNHLNHTMASLSSTVLALCSETPSKLVCIILGGSGGSREWSMSIPNFEEILCVAASSKLVAVATDTRNLRIFSAMGTQREIVSVPGPIVSVGAHDDRIVVAYHSTAASDDQHISIMYIQTIGLSLRCRYFEIPLTPNSKLTWLGFSDKGSPVTCDTMGMVRMFSVKSNCWVPICDTSLHTKGASDSHFIIEVSESMQIVHAILCRGTTYPPTTPKPMVSQLKMQLPVCDIETEQSLLEETLVRNSTFNVDESDKKIKEIALKLFAVRMFKCFTMIFLNTLTLFCIFFYQLACHSENETRAKEFIEMLALPSLIPLVMKYATKLGRIHLADKLGELIPQFEENEREREKYDENEAANDLLMSTSTSNIIRANQQKTTTPSIIPVSSVFTLCISKQFFHNLMNILLTKHYIRVIMTFTCFSFCRNHCLLAVIRSKRPQQAAESQ